MGSVDELAEQENTKMLQMLAAIGKKLEVSFDDDPSLSVLEQATRPEKLAAQIDRASNSVETADGDPSTRLP